MFTGALTPLGHAHRAHARSDALGQTAWSVCKHSLIRQPAKDPIGGTLDSSTKRQADEPYS